MALLDKSKASSAFKLLQGKAHTSNLNELANEAIASGVTMSAQRIFADAIHPTPGDSSNIGIVSDEVILVLEAVSGSDTGQIGTPRAYRTKLGGSVPASLVGKINPLTNAVYAINDYIGGIIPQSFGTNFRPRLYSDAAATVEIPPSSAADWFIDCFAGVVTQEGQDEGASGFTLGANGRVRAYIYIGRFVSEALGAAGAVNFFEGSGITVEETNVAGTAGYAIKLGGTLTENAFIDGATHHVNFNVNSFSVDENGGGIQINADNGGGIYLESNGGGIGISEVGGGGIYIGDNSADDGGIFIESRGGTFINTYNTAGDTFLFKMEFEDVRGALFTDDRATTKGIEYFQDYSAGFTNRSLVDKEYVDLAIASSSVTLLDGSGTTANNGTAGTSINLGGTLTQDTTVAGPYDVTYHTSKFEVITNNGPSDGGIQLINPSGTGSFSVYHGAAAIFEMVSSGSSTGFHIGHYGAGDVEFDSNSPGDMKFLKNGGGSLYFEKNAGTGNLRLQQNSGDEALIIMNTSGDGIEITDTSGPGILLQTSGTDNEILLNASGSVGSIFLNSTSDGLIGLSGSFTNWNRYGYDLALVSDSGGNSRIVNRDGAINLTRWTSSFSENYLVRLASTENIDLVTGGLVRVDGVKVGDSEEVLVMSQTDPVENGLYNTSESGSWTRSSEVGQNEIVYVQYGNINAGRAFYIVDSPVYDVDPIVFYAYEENNNVISITDSIDITSRNAMDIRAGANISFTLTETSGTQFQISSNSTTFPGATYFADYRNNYTDRSLVDKRYVLDNIGYASTSGIATASNGLTKVGQNVKLGGTLTENTTIDFANTYSLTFTGYDGGLYFNDTTGGGTYFQDTGGGGIYVESTGGGIALQDDGGGGISLIDINQGGVYLTSDGGGISLTETGGGLVEINVGSGSFLAYSSNAGLDFDTTNMFLYGQRGTFQVNGGNLDIISKDSGNNVRTRIRMSDTEATFFDTRVGPQKGIEYSADYSANYTNRSLVDKGYVLTQIGYAGTNGIATASNGLTKVGQDVRLGGALTQNTTINAGAFNFEVLFNDGVNSSELEQSDAGFYFDAYNAVDGTYVDINPGYFDVNINSNLLMLVMDQSSHSITFTNANGDGGGVKYAADYSASYTNRSLVDRGYVLTQIGQAGTNGIATASNGLTKVGQDVKLGGNLTENTLIDGFPNNNTIQIRGGASVELNTYSSRQFKLDSSGSSILDGSGGGLIVRATAGSQTTYTTSSITSTAAGGDVAIGVSGGVRIGGGSNTVNLLMSPGSILLTDGAAGKGIEYAADYSANYTDRSLVDKAYVDMVAQGLDPKASVRVATTTYITLSGLQSIDGVTVIAGDRVLVKDQGTSGQDNGIYTAAVGAWTRSSDFDGTPSAEVTAGAYTFVAEGTTQADTGWVLATNDPITIGVTSLSFVQFSAAGQFTASNGLTKVGNNVKLGGLVTENTFINNNGTHTFAIGGDYDPADAFNTIQMFSTDYMYQDVNDGQVWIELSEGVPASGVLNLYSDGLIQFQADVNMILLSPSTSINSDAVQIGTGLGLVELDGSNIELYVQGAELILSNNTASVSANGTVEVEANTFIIDSGVTRILNALTSSTSGYDVVVRNTVTGNLEKVASSTFTGSVPTLNNKYMTPSAGTGGNGNATGLTITSTPTADSYVQVEVNGIGIYLGTSSIIGDGYFAAPGTGGVIGRAIADIQAGDEFYWNSINAGFSLDALDHVDFLYSV